MGETQALVPSEIAQLYEVETKVLIRAMKRNLGRFPPDFMFQLTREELEFLRCQSGTSKGRGGRRYLPYAFTEQGVAMLSSVLNSERAIRVNIELMRAFSRLRHVMSTQSDLVRRLDDLEQKYDDHFKVVFDALRQLMAPPEAPSRRIGFEEI
jgi:phage regulator Rha-like protein